jgi:putative copper export protein
MPSCKIFARRERRLSDSMQIPNTVRIGLIAPIKSRHSFAVVRLAVAVIATAQQPKKVPRVGFLAGVLLPLSRLALRHSARAFARENIVIEWRYAAHAIAVAAWTGAAKYFFDHESHFSLLTRAA